MFALLPPVAPPKLFAPSWNPFSELLLPKKPFVVCAPPSVCRFSHFPVSGFFVYPLFVIGLSGVESATAFPDPILGAFCGADTSGVDCDGAFAVVPAPPTDDPVFALLPPVAPPKLFAPSWNPFSELLLPKKPFVNFAPPSVCGFSHFPVSGFFVYPPFVIGLSGVESTTTFPDPVSGVFCGADASGVDCDGAFGVVPEPVAGPPSELTVPFLIPCWNPFKLSMLPKNPFVSFAPVSGVTFSHFPVSGFFWYPSFITGFGVSGVLPSTTSTSTFLGTSVSVAFCFGVSTSTTFASVGGGTVSTTCFLGGSTTCTLSTFGVSTTCFLLSTGSGFFLIGV